VALHDTKITLGSAKIIRNEKRAYYKRQRTPHGCTDPAETAENLSHMTCGLHKTKIKWVYQRISPSKQIEIAMEFINSYESEVLHKTWRNMSIKV
jgi:hypothetical protein